jgi:hypothetical protein
MWCVCTCVCIVLVYGCVRVCVRGVCIDLPTTAPWVTLCLQLSQGLPPLHLGLASAGWPQGPPQ